MVTIPRFALIRQELPAQAVADVPAEIRRELQRIGLQQRIKPGARIAITAGSRGVHQIGLILKTVVDQVKALGGQPFLIPTMGSHGGATPEGQVEVLQNLGVTEASVGAPILSSLDVVQLGTTAMGLPVYLDQYASGADGIIVVARIKPHTDFRGPIESGLHKMVAIGLGKHKQALAIHDFGIRGLRELVPQVAQVTLEKAPILCGLAILENGHDRTARIEAVLPEDFAAREPQLLGEARSLMARLPAEELDVLVVGQIGKNFSGTGMDTNIIGRVRIHGEPEPEKPRIQYIVALDMSPETHGNALGIGLADFTTERLMKGIDYRATRQNVATSSFVERGKIPLAFPNDREAICAALRCLWRPDPGAARLMCIPNTLEIAQVAVSESLLPELRRSATEVLTPLQPLPFDAAGNLAINYFDQPK